jgi:DNA repair protein SbcD/Mre11
MRILHTSDWHLGRSFHRESLLDGQAAYVDHLVETVRAERVDVVVVAGDVYDRALPPVDAVALCNEALGRLRGAGARTIMISGNHDSARRLGFGAALFEAAGVHLRTDPSLAWEPIVIDDVAFYGIPYLEPELVRRPWELPDRSHTAALSHAMRHIRADAERHPRTVVLAHAFVTGGQASDSERDITVGGAASVPTSTFDGVDYAALGHLHGAQRLSDRVRYSGSPLAYSFSEEHQTKQLLLVELGHEPGAAPRVEAVPTPVDRPLARLSGRLDDLLAGDRWSTVADHYLQVTLTDRTRPREPMERLRQRFPHVLVLAFAPEGAADDQAPSYATRLRGRSDLEVADDFVTHVRGAAEPAETALLAAAFEDVRRLEAAR